MRPCLLGAILFLALTCCLANPIITVNADVEEVPILKQAEEPKKPELEPQNEHKSVPQVEQENSVSDKDNEQQSDNKSVVKEEEVAKSNVEQSPVVVSEETPKEKPEDKQTKETEKVEKTQEKEKADEKTKEAGRQSSGDEAEDDDDDDDDDDLGLGDDDDDDDDDDVAEDADDDDDDDDGDYFERFFDDILGGDDDDDDDEDDDVSPSTGDEPTVNTAQKPAKPVQPPVVEAEPEEEPNTAEDADQDNETGALGSGQTKMPTVYIAKYNKFVDAVINRINRMLGKRYDPVRVKLLSNEKKNVPKKNKHKTATKKRHGADKISPYNKMGDVELARTKYETIQNKTAARSATSEPEFVLISKAGGSPVNTTDSIEELRTPPVEKPRRKTSNSTKKNNKKKNPQKAPVNSNQVKQQPSTNKNKPKAKATLFGLSSLKRDGDVVVNMMSDHTTVKTNFILGPLTLRVEREMAKSGKRILRSATATTAEMYGRLILKIVHGGAATLHSIRVLQPKQVRIDTSDGHDKTTEFMWRRSPQIASMVSQKLTSAMRSMLKPPPQPRP